MRTTSSPQIPHLIIIMKWRQCIPYSAILIKRSKASPASSFNYLSSQSSSASGGMDIIDEEQPSPSIGGGAINEKQRLYQDEIVNPIDGNGSKGNNNINSWNPNDNLSHMLHALVGLDRYPNYLSRFSEVSDMDALETALESRLSDVRRQRLEIIQRRAGIRELVKRYISSVNNGVDGDDIIGSDEVYNSDCSTLWHNHPSLSPPKTWKELRERNMLLDEAFNVAFQSVSNTSKNERKAKSHKSRKHTIEGTNMDKKMQTVKDIIDGTVQVEIDPSLLEGWMDQEMFDVYSFPLLTNEFCRLLRNTLRELYTLAESDEFSHLQLGRRPIDLDTIGLGWITNLLLHIVIKPVALHLFATSERLGSGESSPILDWRQGYVAGYSADPTGSKGATRHRLVPHTDDSEVTLNCCLGEETFVGGNVEFYGLRGTPEEGQLVGKVERPNVGTALIHSGRHLHAVSNVSAGDRYAFIIWARSWSNLRSNTCPCCWLNRRQDSTCICGKRWN